MAWNYIRMHLELREIWNSLIMGNEDQGKSLVGVSLSCSFKQIFFCDSTHSVTAVIVHFGCIQCLLNFKKKKLGAETLSQTLMYVGF